jgi:hypothetical protein
MIFTTELIPHTCGKIGRKSMRDAADEVLLKLARLAGQNLYEKFVHWHWDGSGFY